MSTTPKMLIVEDEGIIAHDIKMQLTQSGFSVTGIAASAEEAFRHIESTAPDLVLMDIRIQGGMDGVEAAQIIRDRYALPVIYLTAHADDTTLERAQQTQPYGYITKPLGNTNLRAIATMALHRHSLDRDLEDHRNMLTTILHGLPGAILVADIAGEVLFINEAAEQLTGWTRQAATGRKFAEVVPIQDWTGRMVSSELLQEAITQSGLIRLPRDSSLVTKSRGAIDISGHLAVAGNYRATRVFLALQDATVQNREEKRLSQEQQLFVAGELARGAAKEFYGLFDLIESRLDESGGPGTNADVVKKACEIGMCMSLHLMEFREAHGPAQVINVSEYLLGSRSILERCCACGDALELEVRVLPDVGYVMGTGKHFIQLLTHLALDGKHRVNGRGKVAIHADVQVRTQSSYRNSSYVRLTVTSERASGDEIEEDGDAWLLGEQADLNLPIIRAIATAAGGYTRVSAPSESICIVEVFLPRLETGTSARTITPEHEQVIMVVGLPLRLADTVQRAAGEGTLLLEANNLNEACLVAELYLGDIDLVVINVDNDALSKTREGAGDRLRARRPNAAFMEISSPADDSGMDALNPSDLARQIDDVLKRRRARESRKVALQQSA